MQVFIKFLLSGVLSAIAQFSFLIFFIEWMSLNPTFSSAAAFTISCIVNYLALYHWAFASDDKHHRVIIKFILATLFTLAINTILFWILLVQLGLWYILAQIIATGCVVIINFFLKKNYIFIRIK